MEKNDTQEILDGSIPIGDRVRIYRRGNVWYANFQEGHRQQRISLKTKSLKEARRRAQKIEMELDAGLWQAKPQTASVEQAVEAYRSYHVTEGRAEKTIKDYNRWLNQVLALAEKRGVKDLNGINLKFVDAYRKQRKEDGVAP